MNRMSSLLMIFLIICLIGGIWFVWRIVKNYDTNGTFKKRPQAGDTVPDDYNSDDTVPIDPDSDTTSFTRPGRK